MSDAEKLQELQRVAAELLTELDAAREDANCGQHRSSEKRLRLTQELKRMLIEQGLADHGFSY